MKVKNLLLLIVILFSTNKAVSQKEPIEKGKFSPTWESLENMKVPDWFRNAKFGIWAHWGPQCEPEEGDWYARFMYVEGSREYKAQIQKYGHPSEFGFKDVCNAWKAENWNPEELVKLYKEAGARYFFAMANHHDNFDNYDSKYQPWNSVNIGPKKDIIGLWEKAARKNGLYFGVSNHAAHAWLFYETSQLSDKKGEKAGIPYDGNLTKEDGKGKWWEGFDPQELYAQQHTPSEGYENPGNIHKQWNWGNGASKPSEEYITRFYNRTIDLINKYNPDLIYFDDTALPLWPVSNAGVEIAAHFYNHNLKRSKGKSEGVIFGKVLTDDQKKALVWDVEKGAPDKIQEQPWQTCTCIGEWHYRRDVYDRNRYKSADKVIKMLVDVVSKNGNMLLNIPVRGDGSIDDKELKVVNEIGEWMKLNSEGIYNSRPWVVFGEGPTANTANPINAQGFNEGKLNYSAEDIRFTSNKNIVYAFVMGKPKSEKISIQSFTTTTDKVKKQIKKVELLGYGKVKFEQNKTGLQVWLPALNKSTDYVLTLKIYQKK